MERRGRTRCLRPMRRSASRSRTGTVRTRPCSPPGRCAGRLFTWSASRQDEYRSSDVPFRMIPAWGAPGGGLGSPPEHGSERARSPCCRAADRGKKSVFSPDDRRRRGLRRIGRHGHPGGHERARCSARAMAVPPPTTAIGTLVGNVTERQPEGLSADERQLRALSAARAFRCGGREEGGARERGLGDLRPLARGAPWATGPASPRSRDAAGGGRIAATSTSAVTPSSCSPSQCRLPASPASVDEAPALSSTRRRGDAGSGAGLRAGGWR